MLFLDQSFRGRDPGRRVGGVVAVESLDGPAQHPAGFIDALKRELDAILLALPAVRVLPAEDGGDADADGFGREDGRESEDATGQQSDPEGHRLFLVKGGSAEASCLIPDLKTIDAHARHANVRVVIAIAPPRPREAPRGTPQTVASIAIGLFHLKLVITVSRRWIPRDAARLSAGRESALDPRRILGDPTVKWA